MASLYHSFKSGTITDAPLTNVATTVNSAGFSALPVITNPDFGWLVLDPEGSAGTPEIVQMTAHSSSATSGTVVRGQQTALGGSTARQHEVGTKWVLALTPSDLAYLLNKILTTKGDIAVFGTDVTRLPAGSNGQVLTSQSTETTGLQWATLTDPGTVLTTKGDLLGTQTGGTLARIPVGSNGATLTALSSDGEGVAWETKGAFATDTQDRDNATTTYSFVTDLAIAHTFISGRKYKITLSWQRSSATNVTGEVCIRVGGAVVLEAQVTGDAQRQTLTYVSSSLTGSVTVDVGVRATAVGTYGIEGTSVTRRPFLVIEDIT